jgi:LysR family glycine cleavage system transcriptional activator
MNRIPKLSLLKAFEAAARLRSFTLAAQELNLTQSAISHQIKELETHFDRQLFVRKNRTVEPTLEGLRFQKSLQRVFSALDAACEELSLTPSAQVLNLYCAPSFAAKWLGPRLPNFIDANPDINIRLSTGAEPIDLNRVREIDLVIGYVNVLDKPGVETLSLGAERTVPLCSPSLLIDQEPVSETLARLHLIESQLSPIGWQRWFTEQNLQLPKRARTSFDRAALAIAAASDGMGIVLESMRLAEREVSRGELVELGGGELTPQFIETHFLQMRSVDVSQTKVCAFRDWLFDECGVRNKEH